MLIKTSPVKVTGYREGQKDGKPMTRRDGSPVEFVQYIAEGEDRPRERVLDKSVNGSRPEAGAVVVLVLDSVMEAWSPAGTDRIYHREKMRVVDFAKAG